MMGLKHQSCAWGWCAKTKENSSQCARENTHQGHISSHNALARVHPLLLCNLAGAVLLEPTYPCPIVWAREWDWRDSLLLMLHGVQTAAGSVIHRRRSPLKWMCHRRDLSGLQWGIPLLCCPFLTIAKQQWRLLSKNRRRFHSHSKIMNDFLMLCLLNQCISKKRAPWGSWFSTSSVNFWSHLQLSAVWILSSISPLKLSLHDFFFSWPTFCRN